MKLLLIALLISINFVHREKSIFIIIACDDRNKSKYNCDSIDVRDSIEHTADGHSSMHYALNSKPSRGESVSNLNDETNC